MRNNLFTLIVLAILLVSCNSSQQTNTGNKAPGITANRAYENDSVNAVEELRAANKEVLKKDSVAAKNELTIISKEKTERETAPPFNQKEAIPSKLRSSLTAEAAKFCDFFKTVDEPSQVFIVPAKEKKELKGKEGTIISVNPEDLTTINNQPVVKEIEVELKELTNQKQLMSANAQTVCNKKLLISGGAYYIHMKSEGQPLKLKEGKTLSVQFPKLTDASMSLFMGKRDSLGEMQWQTTGKAFQSNPRVVSKPLVRKKGMEYDGDILENDTIAKRKPKQQTEEEKQRAKAYESVYAAMALQSFGWINCDRFYNVPDKTDVSLTFNAADKLSFASIFLVFTDINSVIQTHYGVVGNEVTNPGFTNIPVGSNVKLFAFSVKDKKIMTCTSRMMVKKNETLNIVMKETSEEELKGLMK